ncbi:MAG: SUMF1/EgtB/PvdO family nonheme iron enzyme [Saprospiraceae bacterium]
MSGEKPKAIFINYRRALSTAEARLLYLMLQFSFPDEVFLDEETLEAGDRWRPKIKHHIEGAKVLISLIPQGWVEHTGELFTRSKLFYAPTCHVRKEIQTALESGITIIPILLNGATQPAKAHLPKAIRGLFDTFNNGVTLDFNNNPDVADFKKLFTQIAKKAGLEQNEAAKGDNLFQKPLAQEFPLPNDLADYLPEAESPFVELKPFKRADARIFYGRSREIFDLCYKITRQDRPRLLLLDGYSGTGKSSLLQAGLIPRVERQGWAVAYRRREEDKINGLKGVFELLLNDVAAAPESRKLLILDQVEEAVTERIEGLPEELDALAAAIDAALRQHPNYKFILGFRSEQMARIAKVLEKRRLVFDDQNTLYPLDLIGATEAISGAAGDPSLKYQLRFSPAGLPKDIAQRLLRGWENYHVAPLIQVNMELLWQRCRQADGEVIITRHALENIIDKPDGLLDHFIRKIRERITEGQANEQKVLSLLNYYVKDEPASAIRLNDAFLQEADFKDNTFQLLHHELKNQYLLTEINSDGQAATRLSHDVLAKVIQERYKALTSIKLTIMGRNLMISLNTQLLKLQYIQAQESLIQLMKIGISKEELLGPLMELLFFWNEAGVINRMYELFQLLADSTFKSPELSYLLSAVHQTTRRDAVRQWLEITYPGYYSTLKKRYLAPEVFVMTTVQGGSLYIGEDEERRMIQANTFRIANVPTTWYKYGLYLFATGQEALMKGMTPDWGIQGDCPIVNVSWYEAVEYCNWLSETMGLNKAYKIDKSKKDPNNINDRDGQKWIIDVQAKANGYRLPSEIEWEFAARGGQQSKEFTYSGSNKLNEVGWYWANSGEEALEGEWDSAKIRANKIRAQPTGRLTPNELGLYDMSGNIWEWCLDWYGSYPHHIPTGFTGTPSGFDRVLRGGSWEDIEELCCVAFRYWGLPILRNKNTGFRLAQDF